MKDEIRDIITEVENWNLEDEFDKKGRIKVLEYLLSRDTKIEDLKNLNSALLVLSKEDKAEIAELKKQKDILYNIKNKQQVEIKKLRDVLEGIIVLLTDDIEWIEDEYLTVVK